MPALYSIQREQSFPSASQEWDRLAGKHPAYSIFLSHCWLSTWWKHFGRGKELFLLYALQESGQPAAIAPLIKMRTIIKGIPFFRRLSFVEGLETTYRDFIYELEAGEAALGSFMEYLKLDGSWDVMELWNLRQDSPTAEILSKFCDRLGLRCTVFSGIKSAYVGLPGSYDSYLSGLRRSVRQNLRRCQRRLEEIGATYHENKSPDRNDIERFINLHQQRWNQDGQPGVFGTEERREFYRDVLERLSLAGLHRLFEVRIGERTVAAASRFLYGGVMHSFLCGWEKEYAKYAVCKLCVAYSVRRAIEEGFKEYDLSIGDYPHKRDLALGWRTNRNLIVFRTRAGQLKYNLINTVLRMLGKV